MEYLVEYDNKSEVIATADEQQARLLFLKRYNMKPSEARKLRVTTL